MAVEAPAVPIEGGALAPLKALDEPIIDFSGQGRRLSLVARWGQGS